MYQMNKLQKLHFSGIVYQTKIRLEKAGVINNQDLTFIDVLLMILIHLDDDEFLKKIKVQFNKISKTKNKQYIKDDICLILCSLIDWLTIEV